MKLRIYTVFALLSTLLVTKVPSLKINYSDDLPFEIALENESLKIVQFTDLHLTYGFDEFDKRTFALIKNITAEVKPDLIVFTGDQTLSISAPSMYRKLILYMEEFKTPWTFVFGNHDDDFHFFSTLLDSIFRVYTTHMYFKVGPELEDGGYGNFAINTTFGGVPFYNLYFLDSKTEQMTFNRVGVSKYLHFSNAQVSWFKDKVEADKLNNIKSTVFTHIPLVQHRLSLEEEHKDKVKGYQGESVYSQNIDTGFFQAMVDSGVSEAIFFGHDHLNSFTFTHEGITMGYGRISGYNGYGTLKRGARIIEIDETKTLKTYLIYEDLTYEL